jgi:hypothetical protein
VNRLTFKLPVSKDSGTRSQTYEDRYSNRYEKKKAVSELNQPVIVNDFIAQLKYNGSLTRNLILAQKKMRTKHDKISCY